MGALTMEIEKLNNSFVSEKNKKRQERQDKQILQEKLFNYFYNQFKIKEEDFENKYIELNYIKERERILNLFSTSTLSFQYLKPKGWSVEAHNGRLHVRDKNDIMRLRVDPPDKHTPYNHLHIHDKNGKPLDSNWKPVGRRDPESHIRIKEDKNDGTSKKKICLQMLYP